MTYLFLGGIADGKRVDIPEPVPAMWKIAVPISFISTKHDYEGIGIQEEVYHRVRLMDKDSKFVEIFEREGEMQPIRKLVEGYASKKKES